MSSPGVFAMIAFFESLDRRDICFCALGGGDVERSEGETTEIGRVSLVREESASNDTRSPGDFCAVVSVVPCSLELSEEDVDGRG